VTFKTADELRAAAAMVPADRYMVETDAPFLAPVPHRGKRNEPAFVVQTAALLAKVRKQPVDTVAGETTANAVRRFRLDR
jgi:TatD DNase family protein